MQIENHLEKAVAALGEITHENIADSTCNDVTETYAKTAALIAECRQALNELETDLKQELARSLQWHRECVAEYEALGILDAAISKAA